MFIMATSLFSRITITFFSFIRSFVLGELRLDFEFFGEKKINSMIHEFNRFETNKLMDKFK